MTDATFKDNLVSWIIEQGLDDTLYPALISELGRRLIAGGIPVNRISIGGMLLHPVLGANDIVWEAKLDEVRVQKAPRQIFKSDDFKNAPFFHSVLHQEPFIRYRLEDGPCEPEFPIFDKFRAAGMTDYLTYYFFYGNRDKAIWADLPPGIEGIAMSFSTRSIGGFADDEIDLINAISSPLALTAKLINTHELSRTILDSYLGSYSGGMVLDGAIERGDGRLIDCILWYCDLRQSTALADKLPLVDFLQMLNVYFDATAGAVIEHGGEVLRYIGDAVFAIFPYEEGTRPPKAMARAAVATAREAMARVDQRNRERVEAGDEPIRFGISLHTGQVMYGNIGTDERLEFSVIGPAANEVVRLESLCKVTGTPLVASADFKEVSGDEMISLGTHEAAGVEGGLEAFTFPDFMPDD